MRTILLFLALFPICTELVSQNYPYGIIPTMASSQDVDDSYEELRDALTEVDLEGKPSLRVTDGDTKTEYQSFAMIAAALNEDSITFEKLWNWVKYHSDLNTSHNNMYPWRILEVGELRGPVADGDTDIAIALDLAARRWPNWTDGQYDWDYYAKDYIDKIYDHTRAVSLNADSPNVLGGKRIGHPTDEHYYIHYQAYGYYNNYRDRTEESNWTNTGTEMPSVFQTTVDMQRKILGKYYSDENTNPYYWPPHQVDKNGEVADDLIDSGQPNPWSGTSSYCPRPGEANHDPDRRCKYDAGYWSFNWGPQRVIMRAAQAFFNYGYDHSEKFLRYVTERQEEEGGTDRVGRFYFYDKPSPAGTVAPNEPFLMTLGAFCMAYMHDAQYRVQADTMYRRFRDEMATSTDQKAVKAYYMALINGLMILDAPSAGDATRGEHKYLTVNTFEEEIGDSGGDVNINVLSDQNWEITVSESWMEPGLSSGSGNESIMIAIDPNPAETFRSGFVILSADSVSSKYIKINQRGNLTRYKISTSIIGSGSIGIEDFAQDYAAGSELEIVAHPLDSFHFDHWSGDTSSFENPLTLVLTEDINITANFSEGMSSGVDYILQAEEATILNNADIENGVFGYTSSGYVRFTQNTSSIEFSGIRTAMGSFSVSIRSYETFSDSSELVVNNVIHKYKLPSTNGAWVETVIPSVTFDTINQIILRNGKQQKLDRIKIIGGSDSSCPVHLKIDGGRILSDSVYEAKSILEVGAFQISQEQHLQFKAPEVLLLPQFSINNGSNVNVVQTNKCLQE